MRVKLSLGRVLGAVGLLAIVAGAAVAVVVRWGIYDVAATNQHSHLVYWLLDTAKRRSIAHHATDVEVPDLSDPALLRRGLALYREHCTRCHGAPGAPPEDFAKGLEPSPPNLAQVGREWPARDIYRAVREGIKMTGMPAWAFRLDERGLWAVVAFVRRLPALSPAQYQALTAGPQEGPAGKEPLAGLVARAAPDAGYRAPQPGRGRTALRQYACIACHTAPGVSGPVTTAGPPLAGIGSRRYIAGILPNTPDNMVRWIMRPQVILPHNAMPDMGVAEPDARDIAAYLATLR
ncbi:MAG: c-type cytochrome [Rhodospirillaceae bacterium]|nr:c-type cytochrome [Rhodospirillaceae bacterium]